MATTIRRTLPHHREKQEEVEEEKVVVETLWGTGCGPQLRHRSTPVARKGCISI